MDKWQSDGIGYRMRVKNAVRIIDERIETLTEMIGDRKEQEKNPTIGTVEFMANSRDSNHMVVDMYERQSLLLQKIRDELIPEEKS